MTGAPITAATIATRPPLFVLYMPGLDRRLLDPASTPHLCELLAEHPPAVLRTAPTTELLPPIITGVRPETHLMWQVSLDEKPRDATQRLANAVPDFVSTTAQCVGHFLNKHTFDLAAIPWRRRRHFRLHRLSYDRRLAGKLDTRGGRGAPTLFELVPESRYHFTIRFGDARDLLGTHPIEDTPIDFLQFHAFDIFLHWNIDRPDRVARRLRTCDELVRDFRQKCERLGRTMMLVVDHGQTRIERTIDLRRRLAATGVPESDYHYFMEISLARFWFRSEDARTRIVRALEEIPGLQLFRNEDLAAFEIRFPDNRFGDLHVIADHGVAFFPHDFYHPLGNLFQAFALDLARLRSPVHRGNHGQHPDHPAEEGYCTVADPDWKRVRSRGDLVDVLPSILTVQGRELPGHLSGTPLFANGG